LVFESLITTVVETVGVISFNVKVNVSSPSLTKSDMVWNVLTLSSATAVSPIINAPVNEFLCKSEACIPVIVYGTEVPFGTFSVSKNISKVFPSITLEVLFLNEYIAFNETVPVNVDDSVISDVPNVPVIGDTGLNVKVESSVYPRLVFTDAEKAKE